MPAAPFFTILDRVDSTNNYAMAQIHAGKASHGMAWFAREQTAGKGQRGNKWEAEPGKNIALSLVLQPAALKAADRFYLSAAVALACQDLFSKYAGDGIKIKWPNDLYWRDRKAGGILIETVFAGTLWKYAIVGIGLNINQDVFDPLLPNPVSLKQVTGREFDPISLAMALQIMLMERVAALEPPSFKKILQAYNAHLYGRNTKMRLKKNSVVFETLIREVNEKGQLVTEDALERCFDFGEVEWLVVEAGDEQ